MLRALGHSTEVDMFALGRLLVVGFLVLSVVYICLSLYSRAVRRDKLERMGRRDPHR